MEGEIILYSAVSDWATSMVSQGLALPAHVAQESVDDFLVYWGMGVTPWLIDFFGGTPCSKNGGIAQTLRAPIVAGLT